MNDREFIELLNLYVDREITTEDARRLETEVETNHARRKVYDEYCKIQKACSMLSLELAAVENHSLERRAPSFGAPAHWMSPFVAALAAAACVAVIVNHRNRSDEPAVATQAAPIASAAPKAPTLDSSDLASDTDGMRPVFFARQATVQPSTKRVFLAADVGTPIAQLNWIGDMHLSPVVNSGDAHFLQAPRTDLKASVLSDLQSGRDLQEPSEMTAFRFQR